MTPRSVVLIALALAVRPPAAFGQGLPWERQVRQQFQRAAEPLRRDGYTRTHDVQIGVLDTDAAASFTVLLEAGSAYAVIGVCDNDCDGLHLVLRNATGYEIAADRTSGPTPVVQATPRHAARYRVTVTMASCTMNPCWYGLGVYRRPRLDSRGPRPLH